MHSRAVERSEKERVRWRDGESKTYIHIGKKRGRERGVIKEIKESDGRKHAHKRAPLPISTVKDGARESANTRERTREICKALFPNATISDGATERESECKRDL